MDDLKAKLAAQEVELKQKNEDADKLIQARILFPYRRAAENLTVKCLIFSHLHCGRWYLAATPGYIFVQVSRYLSLKFLQ